MAIDAAMADVDAGRIGLVPAHLRDAHYAGAKKIGHGKGYSTRMTSRTAIAAQQYLPDELADARYYEPTDHGAEARGRRAADQDQRAAGPRHAVTAGRLSGRRPAACICRRARDMIDRDYAEALDLTKLASAAGMSKFHFLRCFASAYGVTPAAYLDRTADRTGPGPAPGHQPER